MQKVYWIYTTHIKEILNRITINDFLKICKEHYHLNIDSDLVSGWKFYSVIYWFNDGSMKTSHQFKQYSYDYKQLGISDIIKFYKNENRLQKQDSHVIRGNDTKGNRIQSRRRKASITIGHLSNKAIKS